MSSDQIYYAHAGSLPLARRLSYTARYRIVKRILELMKPTEGLRVVDIGTSDETNLESNMLQQLYPYPRRLTCAGLSNGSAILKAYPAVEHVQIVPGATLPFADGEFDVAYSNAVIEHCGSRSRQEFFIKEMCRISRIRFLIAPNPGFPIEHHTGLPLIHWMPKNIFRALLARSKWSHWAHESNLNYITKEDVVRIWPDGNPSAEHVGIVLGSLSSNFMVFQTAH